ncbi:MAG: hypothetical protein R6V10_15535 [bacterium]
MEEEKKRVKLSGPSRRMMESLAETIIPHEAPDRPGAADIGLVDLLLNWLSTFPGGKTGFVLYCWLWEFSPFLSFKFSRLSRLPLEKRVKLLEKRERSRLYTLRMSFVLLKGLFMGGFYNQPRVWKHIGYDEGCISDPPNPIEEG